jgi:hypothetical protein
MALVTTTKGEMDESLLEKKEGSVDNDNEYTTWVEYWLDGELGSPFCPCSIKKPLTHMAAEAASIA